MNQPTSWDIGGDAGNSFPFDKPGDSVTGSVKSLTEVQQTNMDTGEPEFWPQGQPKMMYRLSLATALRDPANQLDDGTRDIYLKGSRKTESLSSLSAVLGAVKAATGGTTIEPGGIVTLTYTGDGEASGRGKNPPKQYHATYLRPPMNLGGQQQAQQPAYQPQPQQMAQQPQPQQVAQQPVYQPQPQQVAQQPVYQPQPAQQVAQPQQVAQQPVYQPQPQQVPQQAPATAQAWPWTDAQLAALRAGGIDPATVWPNEWPLYLAAGGK
jgi:hypothetical protein